MLKRRSLNTCEFLTKTGRTLYENNKILITKKYGKHNEKNYFNDLLDCFIMLFYGVILIILFPISLLSTLITFIPSVYIKDGGIDEEKRLKEEKENRKIEERFGKKEK